MNCSEQSGESIQRNVEAGIPASGILGILLKIDNSGLKNQSKRIAVRF